MRSVLGCVVVISVVGCDADRINQNEAEAVYQSQTDMMGSVYRTFYDAATGAQVPGGITVTSTSDGATISGTLEDGDGWSGTADLDGSAQIDTSSNDYAFDMGLSYDGVEVDETGVVMDGDVDASTEAHLDTSAGAFSYAFSNSGDLMVSGKAQGHATFDFELSVDVNVSTGLFDISSSGDVSGFDVSGFSLASATSWVLALYQ